MKNILGYPVHEVNLVGDTDPVLIGIGMHENETITILFRATQYNNKKNIGSGGINDNNSKNDYIKIKKPSFLIDEPVFIVWFVDSGINPADYKFNLVVRQGETILHIQEFSGNTSLKTKDYLAFEIKGVA